MPKGAYKKIPNCLRKYRRAHGLNQKEVAKILGLKSHTRISMWENGDYLPSALNVFRLSALYKVMVEALFIDLIRAVRIDITKEADKVLSNKPDSIDQQ